MATNEERQRFETQQIDEIERIFRGMDKLLDALPDHPELAQLIDERLKALQERLLAVERAKPPN
jgi:hypothetical protein